MRQRTLGSVLSRAGLAVVVATASLSCGGGTEPDPPLMCATAEVLLCSNAAARATAREGVSDAAERSTPALENSTARSALATRLGQLEAAIEAGNITSARASLDQARAAIATARGLTTFPGDAADLTVIELMLDYVGPLLI